ncbi:MAG: YdcF family protein [Caldilineae bacterium]|nr:MAG: YdcF family protein [Caldilineae bacterium]
MFVFLSKTLPLLVYPLGLACVLLLVTLFLREQRRQRLLIVLVLVLLWLGGNKWTATLLVSSLERQYPPLPVVPQAPVVVVLGGGSRPPTPPRVLAEVNEAGDRLLYATWLYRQGAASRILVTGGGIEWLHGDEVEARGMAQLLEFLGIPAHAILVESQSRNTYENAAFTAAMLQPQGIHRIILVTSAIHMPRAVRLFQAQGFEVIPAPSDYLVSRADLQILSRPDPRTQLVNLLPNPYYLYLNSLALKEYIGSVVYHLRGWM